jgi:hypothetical protein
MMRQITAIVLAWVLLSPAGTAAPQSDRKPTVKEQVIDIPVGSIVEVRTVNKQKIRGRIGEAADESFVVQRIQNQKLESMTIPFSDAKSIKVLATKDESAGAKAGKTAGWIILGGLAGVGVIVLIAMIAYAAHGGS